MAEEEEVDERAFPQEEIEAILQEVAEKNIKDKVWEEQMIPHWTNAICEQAVAGLCNLGKPYKYIVTCTF